VEAGSACLRRGGPTVVNEPVPGGAGVAGTSKTEHRAKPVHEAQTGSLRLQKSRRRLILTGSSSH